MTMSKKTKRGRGSSKKGKNSSKKGRGSSQRKNLNLVQWLVRVMLLLEELTLIGLHVF